MQMHKIIARLFRYKPSLRLCAMSLFVVSLLLLFPSKALAQTTSATQSGPTLQLQAGFDGNARIGYWTPVQAMLGNQGPEFRGTLSVRAYTGQRFGPIGDTSPWSFATPVELANGAQKQVDFSVPFTLNPSDPLGFVATLLNSTGKTVAQETQTVYAVKTEDLLIGTLSDPNTSFGALANITLPNQTNSLSVASLDTSSMPATETLLENFNILILDDFSTSTLSPAQLTALQTWVNQGGILIEVGGPEWQRTLKPLPHTLLPVVLNATSVLPPQTHLLPTGNRITQAPGQSASDTLPTPITVSTATTLQSQGSTFAQETVLTSGTIPLIVQARQGQGVIFYLAFDPALEPFADWPGAGSFWQSLLLRGLGDRILVSNLAPTYDTGPGQLLIRQGMLPLVYPDVRFALWIVGLLLLGYLLVLGPVRSFIVRRFKQPFWSWRIVLSSILVFTLLSYALAFYQKGAALIDNSISLIQFNQGGTSAHITTYMGVFVPNQGDFQVMLPNPDSQVLAQPVSGPVLLNAPVLSANDQPTVIATDHNGIRVDLLGSGLWTFHPLVAEQDRQLHGGIVTHLALRNERLVGTVTNTLGSSLSDAYVLLPHSFVALGHLAAGATQSIDLPLQTSTPVFGRTLADQIAMSNGIAPSATIGQPQNAFQRHLALLRALSGAGMSNYPCGGSCTTKAIASKHAVVLARNNLPLVPLANSSDPLLVPGATATLIGWADQALDGQDNVTINGISPHGFHDNFIQVPLNLTLSSLANLPPDFISGQVVDEQGTDVQTVQPGIYATTTSSLTFEFALPTLGNLSPQGLTFTIPNMLNSSTAQTTINYVQASLYNWQTGKWDLLTSRNQNTFVTANAATYIGSGGNVLLQVAKQGSALETLVVSRPSLGLS